MTLSGISNAWTGTLDLGGNDLDVKNGNLAALSNQITQAWLAGFQGSGGITSSAAAGDTTSLTTLGIIRNSINGVSSGTALYSRFDNTTAITASTDILVKYTYLGDTNLGGVVDGSDYSNIDNGFINHLTGWFNGDFNDDNVIDGSDYTLIDNAFNQQGATLADVISAPATEVATAAEHKQQSRLTAVTMTVPTQSAFGAEDTGRQEKKRQTLYAEAGLL